MTIHEAAMNLIENSIGFLRLIMFYTLNFVYYN